MTASGLLLLKKPAGISSFRALGIAKKKLGIKKAGHAGTLDSFAEGLLVSGIGEGTKALSHLLLSEKTYRTKIVFGVTSETLDPLSEYVFEKSLMEFSSESLQKAISNFSGEIMQIPPLFSALKVQGRRASDRVRQGEDIELAPRQVMVFETRLLESGVLSEGVFSGLPFAEVFLRVGSGFYVRSFARDLGEKLGTSALCMELCRESVGNFLLADAHFPEEVCMENLLPITSHFFTMPSIALSQEQAERFFLGNAVSFSSEMRHPECTVFLEKNWIGFGSLEQGILQPTRVVKIGA